MRKSVCLAIVTAVILGCGSAWAGVLTFGPATTPGNFNGMPANYGGFVWGPNWGVMSNGYYDSVYQNSYGAPSGAAASNEGGVLSVTTSSNSVFNFDGALFSAFAANDSFQGFSSTTITVNGYNGTTLVGSATMNLTPNGFTYLNASLNGVDRLDFLSSGSPQWWLMDNFTYNSTPEPGSLLLFGTGLLALVRSLKRK